MLNTAVFGGYPEQNGRKETIMSLIDRDWRITIDSTSERIEVFVIDLGSRIEIYSPDQSVRWGDGTVVIADGDRAEDDAIAVAFDLNRDAVNQQGTRFEGHYTVESARLLPLSPLRIQVKGTKETVAKAIEDWTGNRPPAEPTETQQVDS